MDSNATQIKIVSNPYKSEIEYWVFNNGAWNQVDNDNSALKNAKLKRGFFPFVVHDIVAAIIDEYGDNDIVLTFEGTSDEYSELEAALRASCAEKIALQPLEKYLNNAREIITDITHEYLSIKPYINEFDMDGKLQSTAIKYNDVSKDEIPICVVGNYSDGKSTFINALIGHNILTSSNESTTAKIYQIKNCSGNKITIKFIIDTAEATITICKGKDPEIKGLSDDNTLFILLQGAFAECAVKDMWHYAQAAIGTINYSEKVNTLVEIEVPFYQGSPLGQHHSGKFVIFDTPGNNSATNINHAEILEDRMRNMSNGLLIYLATKTSLDTIDNVELCRKLTDKSGIDPRFTILVVNKSETVKDVPDDNDTILNQGLPNGLETNRMFFISSLMGLASKLEPEAIDEADSKYSSYDFEVFLPWFDGSKDSTGKTRKCYLLNILPAQMKEEYTKQADKEENRILANSGLFSVESEIELFAEKYSPYNKCFQSMKFFEDIIEHLKRTIREKSQRLQEEENDYHNMLDDKKKEVLVKLEGVRDELAKQYKNLYSAIMDEARKAVAGKIDVKTIAEDIRKANQTDEQSSVPPEVIIDLIVEEVKRQCLDKIETAQSELNAKSKVFWTEKCREFQMAMISVLTQDRTSLSEEKLESLARIISGFKEISFDSDLVKKMNSADYITTFKLFSFTIIDNQLASFKLYNQANHITRREISEKCKLIIQEHVDIFNEWVKDLFTEINENLGEYSEEIRKILANIRFKQNDIRANNKKLNDVLMCFKHIQDMLKWHSINGDTDEASDTSNDEAVDMGEEAAKSTESPDETE